VGLNGCFHVAQADPQKFFYNNFYENKFYKLSCFSKH